MPYSGVRLVLTNRIVNVRSSVKVVFLRGDTSWRNSVDILPCLMSLVKVYRYILFIGGF